VTFRSRLENPVRSLARSTGRHHPVPQALTSADETPLRAELFTAEQMAQYGHSLAQTHELTYEPAPDRLLPRLAANERVLVAAFAQLSRNSTAQRRATPAGEWLLDNFYLIEEEIRTAKRHLPAGYSRELPRLRNEPSVGLPRVYDLALQSVSHGDGRVSRSALTRFVSSYQTVKVLELGELWAIPIMLRLALIENLRRVAARIAIDQRQRELANSWADRMLEAAETNPKGLILVIADMARSDPPMTSPFIAELARRLQGMSAALALPLTWIEQHLAESHRTIEQLVQIEGQNQAKAQVSVSNSIGSLRALGAMDWRDFVETLSHVEQTLRSDPAGVYAHMDFATRDDYRHAVERIAKHTEQTQVDVARAAVALAADAAAGPSPQTAHHAHVGHYLIGDGRDALEHRVQARLYGWERLGRAMARRPLPLFAGSTIVLTLLLAGAAVLWASQGALFDSLSGVWRWAAGVALLLAASQLAVALVNWGATLLARPKPLPRMDFSSGIPQVSRTLVVVPTMLNSEAAIDHLIEQLEVRFLANRDKHLHFGLLTDFLDADAQSLPGDDVLVEAACWQIDALNRKYAPPGAEPGDGERFFLFHRPRRWNPVERLWMGYERKRGKLADLNALLRGHAGSVPGERFSVIAGDVSVLQDVRYVITLDTDTQLPRDAAWQCVAAMAHPLNRPRFGGDAASPRVVGGYGILQPRVSASLPGANRSLYARLFGGDPGLDPYTRAVSDVYQDLFGEGSFIGKGIYDIDAFEHVLGGRLPENRILSHDLLEGCYARSGLLSDVELVEAPPTRYGTDVSRRHRWIRGDWQILAWTLPALRLPRPGTHSAVWQRNPLSALSRLKILDNLRRSLAPSALLAVFLLAWTVLTPAWAWTLAAVGVLFVPVAVAIVVDLLRKPEELRPRQHLAAVWPPALRQLGQALLTLACLPHEAAFSLHAIGRSLWRLAVTRRGLLEWQASADVARRAPAGSLPDLLHTLRRMWVAPALALAGFATLAAQRPMTLAYAAPVLTLWLVSPLVVWFLSQPLQRRVSTLNPEKTLFLRLLARRTWGFFETFVGAQDNFLPPDNMQEQPTPRIAHRTSPTNIGLSLLANLSAYDFGYLTLGQLLDRTTATLDTMDRLERIQGHFLNWYDTETLQPLRPRYVSSVDSGNLAGHLLTLRAGLLLLIDEDVQPQRLLEGFHDTLHLLAQAAGRHRGHTPIDRFEALLVTALERPAKAPRALAATFDSLCSDAHAIVAWTTETARGDEDDWPASEREELQRWARALVAQCEAAVAEMRIVLCGETGTIDLDDLPDEPAEPPRRAERLQALADRAGAMARMDYEFLYDSARHLMAIGFNVDENRRDTGHYDLLASEVRLTTFVAIAQGQVPQESWFALGRLLTTVEGRPILLSWSGSMFEYLMPMLVMPSYENTLLDQTMHAAVERQMAYGRQRGVPWGISESGYHATDAHLNYQYRAFGVPGLGLKRGLAEDLVVAPYATVMAVMVDARAAWQNLQRLADEGLAGTFGYYEAIDYTPSRLPRGAKSVVVRSYMAHHQGMGLLALAYTLLDKPMQRRFESDPAFQATLLLLQERIPKVVAFHPHTADRSDMRAGFASTEMPVRLITTADTPTPEVQLLSNGRYHVMLTNAGAGYSRWKDLAVTRWREDTTSDAWGSFCYLRDTETGTFWSTTHQPTQWKPDAYEAIFTEGRAEFRRRDQGIDAYTEIVVSPEDDIELRRLRITNLGRARRSIEVTSYAEVVLSPPAADAQHPAFNKLFVQTEQLAEPPALLCTRRPRSADETPPHMLHLMAVHGAPAGEVSHETDRARFIGRGRSLHAPAALREPGPLSGSVGSVLDPVVATRRTVTLAPGQTATIDLVHGMAETREACIALAAKYVDRRLADRVFELAWTHSQVILRQLNASESDAQLYARLAGTVVYSQATLRAHAGVLLGNRRRQSDLWGYAISGDLPIVLLQVGTGENIELVRQMVLAHAWWRLKGLAVDLVIWNEERDIYRQGLQEQILGLIASGIEAQAVDRPGGIFVRHIGQISDEDRGLLQAVARAIVTDRHGTLADQVMRKTVAERRPPALVPTRPAHPATPGTLHTAMQGLQFYNGVGGFSADGREYVIAPGAGERPPAPWVNVLANPRFGTVVSEAGTAYTWCENAHELRLTPWHNDPVADTGGEAVYLRDEESGQVWHPTSLPAPGDLLDDPNAPLYVTRHGFGYSRFDHERTGIHSELTVFVALDEAVKFSRLTVRNDSDRTRRLSATGYVEWVLGDMRHKTGPHTSTEIALDNGALYARNRYSNDFGDWIGFFDVDVDDRLFGSFTCDRTEFIGRNGSLRRPAALRRERLSGRVGAGLDPCAAIQVPFELAPGQSRSIVFRLGMGRSLDEAGQLVARFRGGRAASDELESVRAHWQHTLSAVQVRTPEPSIDLLANGWLIYQTIACRMWARSGYYQSGGAFGFRDQLQDAMALVHTRPLLLREHLLTSASRQFLEGDVQHWWHPPGGRGVRTHIRDDYLWLPLALCRYVQATNDTGVLAEEVPFLDARPVPPHEESYYDLPDRSGDSASLYEHAVRALRHGMRYGSHGLPLMGAGDWNDGMNQVGHHGRGESVWLGFFLCEVLRQFAPIARMNDDELFARQCENERTRLAERLEADGWDGDWYRRAYFDDGTPLGSKDNVECRIDSIAQSWSVLSGVGSPQRVRRAMDSMAEHLVRTDTAIVQLLDPPFDRKGPNPGYIAGYVPGVRENGGQYTHSAIWATMAFAALGDNARAWQLMDLINPLHHGRTPDEVAAYKVEPYVAAADVYSVPPHTGRGGWTWYTGSAGWMYRLIVESLLGVELRTTPAGATLRIAPCLPEQWTGFALDYRWRGTTWHIEVEHGASDELRVNGVRLEASTIALDDDGGTHEVRVRIGERAATAAPRITS